MRWAHYQEAEWGGGTYRPVSLLIHLSTQLQDYRTSLAHLHPLLVQIFDLNRSVQDQVLEQPPSHAAGEEGKVMHPPALFNRNLSPAHLKGTTVRREPAARSLPSGVNPAGDWTCRCTGHSRAGGWYVRSQMQ